MQEEKAMSEKFVRLAEVMKRLRAPDGCPWDREQTHVSIAKNILVTEAIVVDAGAAEPGMTGPMPGMM